MAMVKRHWKAFIFCFVVLVGCGIWLSLTNMTAQPVKADDPEEQESEVTVDARAYTSVMALRKELSLDNEALAAMGCTQAQATEVLQTLLAWYDTNKTSLDTAAQSVVAARKNLRVAQRKIHMGPRDEELIATVPGLQSALASAIQQRRTLVNSAVSAVEAELSESQKTLWSTARSYSGRYRFVSGLTTEQTRALGVASRARARGLAVADSSEQSSLIQTAFDTTQAEILTSSQQTALTTARSSITSNMSGVLAAETAVLPLPEELQSPETETELSPE